jgi:hypothetical protein
MPARHTGFQEDLLQEHDLLLEADSIGGSGRRKRVSARHQVKRLDRIFEGLALWKPVLQKKQVSSFGADFWSAISPAAKPLVKSGPDVFADALVPLSRR